MSAEWTSDQSLWPEHLRDDAPTQKCGRCGRFTWGVTEGVNPVFDWR